MLDGLEALLTSAITSPWVYLAIFAVALVDAFLPVVPSESLVITAGVFAASGSPEIPAVVAVAAAGAFLGDHVSYLLGRSARGLARRRPSAMDWARRMLAERGGLTLVVARYVPGGRTAVTLTAGALGYPPRRFTPFVALAAVTWAGYSAAVGHLGGRAFEDDPLHGLAAGLGLALSITVVVESIRQYRRRRAARGSLIGRHPPARPTRPSPPAGDRRSTAGTPRPGR